METDHLGEKITAERLLWHHHKGLSYFEEGTTSRIIA
jgi:hypothetical protein